MKIILNVEKVGKEYILTKPIFKDTITRKLNPNFLQSIRKYKSFKLPSTFIPEVPLERP